MAPSNISKNSSTWTSPGIRKRGRPRTSGKGMFNKDIAEKSLTKRTPEKLTNDRSRWRELFEV